MSTEVDRQEFAGMIGALDVLFSKESSKVKAQLYWDGLKDIPIEDLRAGFLKAKLTLDRYPTIAKWRACCELAARERDKRKDDASFQKRLAAVAAQRAAMDQATGEVFEPSFACAICEDTGWAYVEHGTGKTISYNEVVQRGREYVSYVKRCECWGHRERGRQAYADIREERQWANG
jgi:hypothetical protein